jgi:Cu+-exporting ATPase
MLTGDDERTAKTVARKLNIDEVEAGVEPQWKNERVRELHEQGRIVAMAEMGSTTHPRLLRQISALRWAQAPMSRWKAPESL